MIDIRISVSDVDYEAALDTLLPVLVEHFSKKSKNSLICLFCQQIRLFQIQAIKRLLYH